MRPYLRNLRSAPSSVLQIPSRVREAPPRASFCVEPAYSQGLQRDISPETEVFHAAQLHQANAQWGEKREEYILFLSFVYFGTTRKLQEYPALEHREDRSKSSEQLRGCCHKKNCNNLSRLFPSVTLFCL